MRRKRLLAASTAAFITGLIAASGAAATETITYTYDAQGRLVKVVRSGTVNNGETVDYQHDDADNRTQKQTTGA
jgi:YD repeat-containing protein